MFHINKSDNSKPTTLDDVIDDVYSNLIGFTPDQEEYQLILDRLSKLHELKNAQRSKRVSPDTMAVVIGNLLGIGLIVGHERAHVVTSKALGFVMKAAK